MRTVKIILAAALAIFMVASCKDPNFVSRQDYDALMKEYEDLQAGSAAIREEYAQQAKSVDNILEKLSQISGSTVVLRSDMERGTAQMTQVQQIEDGLDNIKDQLDELEKATKSNRQLRGMVASLKKVIAQKEAEIEEGVEHEDHKAPISDSRSSDIAGEKVVIGNENEDIADDG